jgi:hypothetical protein
MEPAPVRQQDALVGDLMEQRVCEAERPALGEGVCGDFLK